MNLFPNSPPKNIGIDLRSLLSPTRTGVGEYTAELLDAIFKQDKKNNYFLFLNSYKNKHDLFSLWKNPHIEYVETHFPNKLFNACVWATKKPALDTLILRHSKKIMQLKIAMLDLFFSPNLNFTNILPPTKHILTIHDLSFELFPHFFSFKQQMWHKLVKPKKQCEEAHIIFTPSENTKRDLVNYYHISPNKIRVLYPGLSHYFSNDLNIEYTAEVKKKYNLQNNFILFLGTNEPRKNILTLLMAFESCFSQLPQKFTLVIAGSSGWKNKKIDEYLLYSPIKNNVQFIGYIDPRDKPYLFKLASLFVYPSFYEGFGFPVLEAMASKTPVIASNRSSLPEITSRYTYLFNPHSPSLLADGIVKILSDEIFKKFLTEKAFEHIQKFSWQKTASEWLEIINSI